MRFGLAVPNFADFSDVHLIQEVVTSAEASGWDGFFLWDHIARSSAWEPGLPFADVTVALTAVALATTRITFGTLVTPVPRRRPQKLAREFATLDRLSGGRVVLGVGIGSPVQDEFTAFGEQDDARTRGDILDESLEAIQRLWSGEPVDLDGEHVRIHTPPFLPTPLQRPRIPIWAAARWPSTGRTLRRARGLDGIVPIPANPSGDERLQPEDVAEVRRAVGDELEIVVTGHDDADPADFERAGATWYVVAATDKEKAQATATSHPPHGKS
ncbi:MAG: LLM class flavin-dependent oxidoreductase [Actinomycetota bacterium]